VSTGFYLSYGALWSLFLALGVLVLLLYRHFGLMAMSGVEGIRRDGLALGEVAPAIRGSAADGHEETWEPGRAPSFVIFAAPDCEPCAEVLPHVAQLASGANGIPLRMLAVADGRQESAERMLEKYELPFDCLAEGAGGAFKAYRVRVTPFAFVLDEDGRVLAKGLCNSVSTLRGLFTEAGLTELAALVQDGAGEGEDGSTQRYEVDRAEEVSV
jgi:methylamine dehydrogenase accessory protein MauD